MSFFNWTPEICDTIRAWWEIGKSAGWITRELNGPSRNSIIGKLHRMGAVRGERGRQEPECLAASAKGRKRI